MTHFRLLKEPQNYVAHDWDLCAEPGSQTRWLDLFENHFDVTLDHARDRYGRRCERRITPARAEFGALILRLRKDPTDLPGGTLNVMELCRQRERVLRAHGLDDPFGHIKARENDSAIALYPQVVRELHARENHARWLRLIKCVFAGNIFDLGSGATMHLAHTPTDFLAAADDIRPRPWLVDDYDLLWADLESAPPTKWAKAVVFIDNAGSDFILGVMPLARELALGGTKIILAANELPSLNDMTAGETVEVVERLSFMDDDLAALIGAGMFEVVSTGNGIPLIDLSEVPDELNEAAEDADLLILEGMGRAIESNFDAAFTVDTLHLALLKDPTVAKRLGGELYDCICKYIPSSAPSP